MHIFDPSSGNNGSTKSKESVKGNFPREKCNDLKNFIENYILKRLE